MFNKVTYKLAKALYKQDLPEEAVRKILKRADFDRPVQYVRKLEEDGMISVRHIGGIPDGEGGYLDGTVKRIYHLAPNGRAEVDRVRRSRLKWLVGTGIALAAATGAILSALSNWVC